MKVILKKNIVNVGKMGEIKQVKDGYARNYLLPHALVEPATEGALAKGCFYRPTVFAGVRPDARIAVEEVFGPVLSVVKVKDFAEAVQINNASSFGLSSSIFTRDVNRAFAAMRDLDTGIVYVNHGTTGAEIHLPFGGMRGTGNGHREAGHTLLDPFTEWKSIYVDFSGRLQRAQIDVV